jgi:hypothetical protein
MPNGPRQLYSVPELPSRLQNQHDQPRASHASVQHCLGPTKVMVTFEWEIPTKNYLCVRFLTCPRELYRMTSKGSARLVETREQI